VLPSQRNRTHAIWSLWTLAVDSRNSVSWAGSLWNTTLDIDDLPPLTAGQQSCRLSGQPQGSTTLACPSVIVEAGPWEVAPSVTRPACSHRASVTPGGSAHKHDEDLAWPDSHGLPCFCCRRPCTAVQLHRAKRWRLLRLDHDRRRKKKKFRSAGRWLEGAYNSRARREHL
jgi:hypothetical protein